MNFTKFPHSAMFVGAINVGNTEHYLLRILETKYKSFRIHHYYVFDSFK